MTATFVYDGDGNRVKATIGTTTTYVGNYFEWTGSTSTMNVRSRYYYEGSIKVAMRTGSSTLNYLLGDHLGSNAITTNSSGVRTAEVRYYPWGRGALHGWEKGRARRVRATQDDFAGWRRLILVCGSDAHLFGVDLHALEVRKTQVAEGETHAHPQLLKHDGITFQDARSPNPAQAGRRPRGCFHYPVLRSQGNHRWAAHPQPPPHSPACR